MSRWYHVAGVQDTAARTVTLYVNGSVEAQIQLNGAPMHGTAPLLIGAREYMGQGRPSDMFNGIIDDVRIWNVARTSTEITGMMYKSLSGNQPGLVANWKFDEGRGATTFDHSRSHIGYLIDAPAWVISTAPTQ